MSQHQHSAQTAHAHEYAAIRGDLVRVVILNLVYLAAILALYYANKSSHFLDRWFAGKLQI